MKLLESDLFLISKLAFKQPKEIFVLDPGNMCFSNVACGFRYVRNRKEVDALSKHPRNYYLINISGATTFSFPLNFSKVDGIIILSKKIETSADYFHTLAYIKSDRNGRIKWVLSEHHKKADFLSDLDENKTLIDVNNFFSVFPFVFNLIRLKLGFTGSVANGKIQFLLKERYLFNGLENRSHESFSFNLANAFSNGILHLRFFRKNKWVFSAKRQLNMEGKKKLNNEKQLTTELAKKTYKQLAFPKVTEYPDGYILDFPTTFRGTDYYRIQKWINKRFTQAIFEYSLAHLSEISVQDLLKEFRIYEILDHIRKFIEQQKFPKGLSIVNFVKVYKALVLILNNLELKSQIPASISNRDLFPTNIGYSKARILLLKWENGRQVFPLLFDFFDYSFNYIEDFESPEIEYLINDLNAFKCSQEFEELTKKTKLDFNLHLSVFSLIRITPILTAYLGKGVVVPESNLKLFVWAEFFDHFEKDKE